MMKNGGFQELKYSVFEIASFIAAAVLLFGIVLYMACGADGLGSVAISVTFILTLLSAVLVIIGVVNRFVQRSKSYASLTKRQKVCGYGLMTFGGLAAGVFSFISVIADMTWQYETGVFAAAQCVMCAGGLLCFAFGLKSKQKPQ